MDYRQERSQFKLVFSANGAGVSKRVEFHRAAFSEILAFVEADEARRFVSVWENGIFRCHLVHRKNHVYECDSPGFAAEGIPEL